MGFFDVFETNNLGMYEPVSRSSNVILHASPSQCPRWRQSFPTQLKGIHTRPLIFSVYTVLLCSGHWYSRRRGQENMGSCRLYQNAEEFYTKSLTDRSPCLVIIGQGVSGLWYGLWTTIFTTVFPSSRGYLVAPQVDP